MMDDLDLEQLKKELGDTPDGGGRFTVDDILREAELEQSHAAGQTYSLIEQQDELAGAAEAKDETDPLAEQEDVFAKMVENIEQTRPNDAQTAEKSLADERMDAFARMIAAMETEEDTPEREEPVLESPTKKERRKPKAHDASQEYGTSDLEPDEPETDEQRTLPFSQDESGWEELESEANGEPDDEDYEEREESRGLLSRIFGETEEESDEPEEAAGAQPRGGFWSRLFGGSREEREEQPAPAAESPEENAWTESPEEENEDVPAELPEEELVTVPEPEEKTEPKESFWSRLFRMDDAMANDFSDLDDDESEEDEEEVDYEEEYDEESDDELDKEEYEDEEEASPRGGFFSRLFGRAEQEESDRHDEDDTYDEDDFDEDVPDERVFEEDERELPEDDMPGDDRVTAAFAEAQVSSESDEEAFAQETRVMPELPESEPKPLTEEELLAQTRVIGGVQEMHEEAVQEPQPAAESAAEEPMDVAGSDFWSRLFGTDSLRAEQNAASEASEETRVMPELRAEEQRPLTYEELLAQTRVVPTVNKPEEQADRAQAASMLLQDESAEPAISEEELKEFLTDARSSEEAGASFEELLRDSGAPETPKPKKIEFDAFPEKETTVYFDITVPKQSETADEESRRAELFDAEEALEEAEEQRARQEEKRRLIEDSTDDSWIGLSLEELSKLAPPLEELRREGPVMVREVERQKEQILERRRRYLEKREAERRRAEEEAQANAAAEQAAQEAAEMEGEPTETPVPIENGTPADAPQEPVSAAPDSVEATGKTEESPVFR